MLAEPAWYALAVAPRHEKAVARALEAREVEGFLPLYAELRRWSDRRQRVDLPLFPGYVFCRLAYPQRFRAVSTPGVRALVGFGGQDAAIPEGEIDAVRRMAAAALGHPWPYVRPGDRVRILEGPLSGLEGTLVRQQHGCRVVVSVELLQRSVAVEVPDGWIAARAG